MTILAAILLASVVSALWQRSITAVLGEIVGHPADLIAAVRVRCAEWLRSARASLLVERRAFDRRVREDRPVSLLWGALTVTIFFFAMFLPEANLAQQSLAALLPDHAPAADVVAGQASAGPAAKAWAPFGLGFGTTQAQMAASILAPLIFLSWVMWELGGGAPRLLLLGADEAARQSLRRRSKAGVALAMLAGVALCAVRSDRLLQVDPLAGVESAQAADAISTGPGVTAPAGDISVGTASSAASGRFSLWSDRIGTYVVSIATFCALAIGVGVSFTLGPLVLLGMLRPAYASLAIAALLVALTTLTDALWRIIAGVPRAVLLVLQHVGVFLVRAPVTLMRRLHDSEASRGGNARLWVIALTAPALDLQIPVDPVGRHLTIDPPDTNELPVAAPSPAARPAEPRQQMPPTDVFTDEADRPEDNSEPISVWGPFAGANPTPRT